MNVAVLTRAVASRIDTQIVYSAHISFSIFNVQVFKNTYKPINKSNSGKLFEHCAKSCSNRHLLKTAIGRQCWSSYSFLFLWNSPPPPLQHSSLFIQTIMYTKISYTSVKVWLPFQFKKRTLQNFG